MEQLLSWARTSKWQQLLEWVEVGRRCTATPLQPGWGWGLCNHWHPHLHCLYVHSFYQKCLLGSVDSSRPQRGHHLGNQGTRHCASPWMGSSLDAQNSSLSKEGFSPSVLLTSLLWGAVLYHVEFSAASLSPTSPGASNTPLIPTTKKHVQALPKFLSLAESPVGNHGSKGLWWCVEKTPFEIPARS